MVNETIKFVSIILIYLHFSGIIRGQTNLKSHDPKKCLNKTQAWGIDEDCPWPEFSPHEADVSGCSYLCMQ